VVYKQYKPSEKLRHFIRYFWSYESESQETQALHIRSFADKYPRLIFQSVNEYTRIRYRDGQFAPVCYLSGVDTFPTDAYWENSFSHFGVSFFPHALSVFFNIHASELVNTMPDIHSFGGKKLVSQLQKSSHQQKIIILSRFFEDKLAQAHPDFFIHQLVHSEDIQQENAIEFLRKKYAFSERQFQRKVKQHIGISFKKYQRIDKFEKAIQCINNADFENFTTLAHQLNYFDQSHFIRDFTSFSGTAPSVYTSKMSVGSESSSFIYSDELKI
jgi:AraC-like DNA-binding protein